MTKLGKVKSGSAQPDASVLTETEFSKERESASSSETERVSVSCRIELTAG